VHVAAAAAVSAAAAAAAAAAADPRPPRERITRTGRHESIEQNGFSTKLSKIRLKLPPLSEEIWN